jgi:hypothetical protein
MADSASVTFRKICVEDMATTAGIAQITATVMGVGSISLTALVLAAGDAAAATAGVLVGQVYVDSSVTPNRLRVRMS